MVMLKVVMRWAYRKHYHNNTVFETVKTNMKSAPKKVVFFNMKELKQLEEYEIPKQNSHLEKTRDVFLFMCYTGLRYSDVANLKRCDIQENRIEIVTEKTNVVLSIDLNSHSRRVLQKYERYRFKKDAALPMISNQKMNQNLHELCKLAGFNQPIRIINYQGCQRIDEIKPKYEVIGTHTGRRSFICNAISMGIPPQVVMKWTGHSDYKAMKPYIDVCDEIKAEAMKKFDDP
jgi:integrase